MTIIHHNELPLQKGNTSRIIHRKIIDTDTGAKSCQLWEQYLPLDGYIIPHSHPTEEVITFLTGEVVVTLGGETAVAQAPATLLIPPNTIHSIQNKGTEEVHLLAFFPTNHPKIIYPGAQPDPIVWA